MKKINRILLWILCVVWTGCTTGSKEYKPDISTYKSPQGTDVYKPEHTSIAERYKIPEWYRDAKFGIFIHWGVYAVPAFKGEWYPREMYQKGSEQYQHHIETYGAQTEFGYKDFIPMFKAEQFDADAWIALFKKAGIRYIVPVAEHHDGFSMYASVMNKWNAADMGPKQDIIGALKKSAEAAGLHFGLSSHRAENAWFYNGGMEFPSDVQDSTYRSLYGECLAYPGGHTLECPVGAGFNAHSKKRWLEHTYELIDLYQPELMYFDWSVGKYPFQTTFFQYMAYYYNSALDWNKEVVINTKFGYGSDIQVFDMERGKSAEIREYPWQTDTSIGKNSWGYIVGESNKTPNHIIDDLVDIVSKNGNLLLNIGPKPDGTITEEQTNVLLAIGQWLDVNGEAIYDTRPWVTSGEGDVKGTSGSFTDSEETVYTAHDIRFTMQKDGKVLYAVFLAWPEEEILIKSIGSEVKVDGVSLLGSAQAIAYSQTEDGLLVRFPKEPVGDYAHTLKITLQ